MTIKDEFSAMPISRQRKHQLRNNAKGLCARCNLPLDPSSETLCSTHLVHVRKMMRRVLGVKKPRK